MDMNAFWSGFATAAAVVTLAVLVRLGDSATSVRIAVAVLVAVSALAAAGFSHEARRGS